jgi:hypothetical protein
MLEEEIMPHIPHVSNSWTLGTVLASITSLLSLLGMIGTVIWFSSHVNDAVAGIPNVIKTQQSYGTDINTLKIQQQYTDMRYAEIMTELSKINQKLDEQRDRRSQ